MLCLDRRWTAVWTAAIALLFIPVPICGAGKKQRQRDLTPLERYLLEAAERPGSARGGGSPGSLYGSGGRLADAGRDLRASQVDDIITVVVSDRASAVAKGGTSAARQSSAKHSVSALFGPLPAAGALANLAAASGDTQLDGQGETTRSSTLTTTLSARVARVLPNGFLVVEGAKNVQVNSEWQSVQLRGVVRPEDLSPGNQVYSDRLAMMELRINGKGVVGDAIRRPNFLYRLLLGLLPF